MRRQKTLKIYMLVEIGLQLNVNVRQLLNMLTINPASLNVLV